jgi:hypothetical protein
MGMRLVWLLLALVAVAALPVAGEAAVSVNGVRLDPDELATDSTTSTPRPRGRVIAGLPSIVVEGVFGIYTIGRCPGCPGPARLVIDDGLATGVHRLILTDARVQVRAGASATQLAPGLAFLIDTPFAPELAAGFYPHGVTMDGTFGCRGTGRCVPPTDNRVEVSAFGGHEVATQLIKAGGGTTEPSLRFTVSKTRSFARQGIEDVTCPGSCFPAGILKILLEFGAGGDVLDLPGSIGLLGSRDQGPFGLGQLQAAMNALLASSATAGGECGGAVPCACGNTLMASRTLDGDPIIQSVCPGDGLLIGQSDVVLTIKGGNTIRGSGEGAGILLGAGVGGVTVQSGAIAGFATGVRATGNAGGRFANLRVIGNTDAGLDVTGDGNTIEGVIAEANGTGIAVEGDGNVVKGSRSDRNDTGLAVGGAGNTVSRNVVKRSAGQGMVIDGAGALVERNQVSASGDDGLTVTGTGHTVTRNAMKLNRGDGLAIPDGGGIGVSRNRTDRSGGHGILDGTTGGGTGGTANTYTQNVCDADALGDSSPGGLCL